MIPNYTPKVQSEYSLKMQNFTKRTLSYFLKLLTLSHLFVSNRGEFEMCKLFLFVDCIHIFALDKLYQRRDIDIFFNAFIIETIQVDNFVEIFN